MRLKNFIICFVCSLYLIAVSTVFNVYADENSGNVSVSAQACVLYCPNNGQILYAKHENSKMKMASTTKIMTTLLALEYAATNDKTVKFTDEMVAEGSSMYLQVGDEVKVSDLAKGMMAASGNDAANAAAITVAGDKEKFAVLMNERAKQIGMKNTNFVTPSGLDDDNHYSTAYDMALLMSYALENEDFAKITSQKSLEVEFIKPESKKSVYKNHNRLLSLYDYCIGGKTGFTKAAGRCLVTAARKNDIILIAVTLNAPSDWNDHINMYDYGFSQLESIACDDTNTEYTVPVVGGKSDEIKVSAHIEKQFVIRKGFSKKIEKKVYLPNFVYAPVSKGDKIGYIEYFYDNKSIGKCDLFCNSNVEYYNGDNKFIAFIKNLFSS